MPNRMLKESLCTSEKIAGLSWFEEVCFTRLLLAADDYGHMDARPGLLAARMFPLRRDVELKDIAAAVDALCAAGLVARYEVDGKGYLALPGWEKHQRLRFRRAACPQPVGEGVASCGGGASGIGGASAGAGGVDGAGACVDASGGARVGFGVLAPRPCVGVGASVCACGGNGCAYAGDAGSAGACAGDAGAHAGSVGAGIAGVCAGDVGARAGNAGAHMGAQAGGRLIAFEVEAEGEGEAEEKEGGDTQKAPPVFFPARAFGKGPGGFVPPTLAQVEGYIRAQGYGVSARRFVDFYTSKGWLVGSSPMRSWKAALNLWEANRKADELAGARLAQKAARAGRAVLFGAAGARAGTNGANGPAQDTGGAGSGGFGSFGGFGGRAMGNPFEEAGL